MTDPDKGAAPIHGEASSPSPAPAPARTVPLDPLAAFFRRKAEFMEREAIALALQIREAGQAPEHTTHEDDR